MRGASPGPIQGAHGRRPRQIQHSIRQQRRLLPGGSLRPHAANPENGAGYPVCQPNLLSCYASLVKTVLKTHQWKRVTNVC